MKISPVRAGESERKSEKKRRQSVLLDSNSTRQIKIMIKTRVKDRMQNSIMTVSALITTKKCFIF